MAGSSTTADGTAATTVEALERLAGPLAPGLQLGHDDGADVLRVAQPQHRAVGDLAGQAQHRRRQRGDVDRQVGVGADAAQREARLPLLAGRRRLAGEDRAQDRDVLAHLGHGPVDRLPVPALDDGAVRDAEAEAQAPPGLLVQRRRRHRHRRRRARVDRHHAGAQADARRRRPRSRRARSASRAPRCGSRRPRRSRAPRRAGRARPRRRASARPRRSFRWPCATSG